MKKLKKDTTSIIALRVDKDLKARLQEKFGRKLSNKVIPFLEKIK